MRKKLFSLLVIISIIGSGKKEEKIETKKVLSYGELICVYKEQNNSDNTMYTSLYVFNFDNNGILNGASNKETIEFYDSNKDIKEVYKKNLDEVIKEYKEISGIEVKKELDNNKYSFEIIMDNNKMYDETKKDFLLDQDRISLYNYYTNNKYTCE